jgi:hypothetical protein
LGGTAQCLFINQVRCTHQRLGLQQHSCSQISIQVRI